MAYTEHFRIRRSPNKDKTASYFQDSSHREDIQKPIIHICIHEDSESDTVPITQEEIPSMPSTE